MIVIVLLLDIALIGTLSLLYIFNGNVEMATYKLIEGSIRLFFTALLLFFVYKGNGWAKWISFVLFVMGGTYALISMIIVFNVLYMIMALVYLTFSLTLTKYRSENDFFAYQRN